MFGARRHLENADDAFPKKAHTVFGRDSSAVGDEFSTSMNRNYTPLWRVRRRRRARYVLASAVAVSVSVAGSGMGA
jgi:hypothetical protein